MNKVVEKFIEKQKAELEAKNNLKKEKLLIDLGIYDKEYSDNTAWSEEYPKYEYDQNTQEAKYYKIVPIQVTDEEYAEILKYSNLNKEEETDKSNNKNTISQVFTGIAWAIFILGFILGFAMGYQQIEYSDKFKFSVALIYWCISFVSGMVMLGFSEIIKLLNELKNK